MVDPVLSVVVPVYNGERYLMEALDSIREQNDAAIEIIVIDDGSIDQTAVIARGCRDIRYVRQENQGPAAARNQGIELAQAGLIAFLDADDLWAPCKLHLQLAALRGDAAMDMVSGHVQCLRLTVSDDWELFEEPRYLPLFGATVARRAVFDRVGALDEALRCGEDVDWFMRARDTGVRTAVLDEVVLFYRLHGANLTKGWTPQQAGYAHAVKKLLDRRRQGRLE